MKKFSLVLFALALMCVTKNSYAQKKNKSTEGMMTAEFDDGTKIDFKVLQSDLNEMHQWAIETGKMTSHFRYIAAYYHSPDQYFVSINYGDGFGIEGVYYLKQDEKPTKLGISLKSEYTGANTVTRYVVNIPDAKRKFYVGPHIGYSHIDNNNLKAEEIAVGGALVRGRHNKTLMQTKKGKLITKRGTSFNTLYADVLLYPSRTVKDSNSNGSLLGFQLYYGGRTSFWGTREWGFNYALGGGSSPKGFFPVLGFGIYAGF